MPEFLEQHIASVFRFALRLSGSRDAAEDLAQETMMRAWRSRERLDDRADARVWLFRIAVNCWRDTLRRRRVRFTVSLDHDAGPVVHPSASPDRRIRQREETDSILAALDALPERQRDVLYLHACEELANPHIAEILGINVNAVKASLSVARRAVRARLDPHASPDSTETAHAKDT